MEREKKRAASNKDGDDDNEDEDATDVIMLELNSGRGRNDNIKDFKPILENIRNLIYDCLFDSLEHYFSKLPRVASAARVFDLRCLPSDEQLSTWVVKELTPAMEFLFDYGKDKSTLKFNKESGSFAREV